MKFTKHLRTFAILACALLAIACENKIGSSENLNSQTKQKTLELPNDGLYKLGMGSGYDTFSKTGTSRQPCLKAASDPNNILIANPTAIINIEQLSDLSSLQDSLGVDVSTKIGADRFMVSAAANFARDSKDDAYSTSFIYLYKYAGDAVFRAGSLNQGDDALTPVAIMKRNKAPADFREMCGNGYVSQMDAGAVLGVRLTLTFNSHVDQQRFNANMSASLGLNNIAAAIQKATTQSNVHVGFSLSAIQLGGQPQKLNQIFKKPDPSKNYPFVDCGDIKGTDNNACKTMISDIIEYAAGMDAQLSTPDGKINLDNLYYSNPTIEKYSNLGIDTQAPDPSDEVLDAMQKLTKNYDKAVYDYKFISHYVHILENKLDNETTVNLGNMQKKVANQIKNVYGAPVYNVINCYRGYVSTECVDIKRKVDNALKDFQFTQTQQNLLDYLENNSYRADLYMFYPNIDSNGQYIIPKNEKDGQYRLSRGCILAPVSAQDDAEFALNCDGQWLNLEDKKTLKIIDKGITKSLFISGLSYISSVIDYNSQSGNFFKPLITYSDIDAQQKPSDENAYYMDGITITKDKNKPITDNGEIHIMRLFENQA